MTDTNLVPPDVHTAAKRAFIRTGAQSLASNGVLTGATTLAFTGDAALAAGLAVAGAIIGAAASGVQAYFAMIARGIPEDYTPTAIE